VEKEKASWALNLLFSQQQKGSPSGSQWIAGVSVLPAFCEVKQTQQIIVDLLYSALQYESLADSFLAYVQFILRCEENRELAYQRLGYHVQRIMLSRQAVFNVLLDNAELYSQAATILFIFSTMAPPQEEFITLQWEKEKTTKQISFDFFLATLMFLSHKLPSTNETQAQEIQPMFDHLLSLLFPHGSSLPSFLHFSQGSSVAYLLDQPVAQALCFSPNINLVRLGVHSLTKENVVITFGKFGLSNESLLLLVQRVENEYNFNDKNDKDLFNEIIQAHGLPYFFIQKKLQLLGIPLKSKFQSFLLDNVQSGEVKNKKVDYSVLDSALASSLSNYLSSNNFNINFHNNNISMEVEHTK
jgi:hypothetical protein